MGACIVYMTAADADEAGRIGRMLVDSRLAACVNVLGPVTALFRWEGAVQQARETAFIAKTWDDRLPELTEAVRKAHSYEVPCIVALPLAGGDAAFIEWIREQTRPAMYA